MKIFIFKDTNLDEGLLFSDNKTTASKLSKINSTDEVAFVLPNEMLSHKYFSNVNLNIKEIKAAIINDEILNPGRSNDQLNVLGPVDKHNYYVVADEDKKLIENKLSKFGSSYNLISDAFLYVTLMDKNCQYNDSIYIASKNSSANLNSQIKKGQELPIKQGPFDLRLISLPKSVAESIKKGRSDQPDTQKKKILAVIFFILCG